MLKRTKCTRDMYSMGKNSSDHSNSKRQFFLTLNPDSNKSKSTISMIPMLLRVILYSCSTNISSESDLFNEKKNNLDSSKQVRGKALKQ